MVVLKWRQEREAWEAKTRARKAIGKGLTPAAQRKFEAWSSEPTRQLVLDTHRQTTLTVPVSTWKFSQQAVPE